LIGLSPWPERFVVPQRVARWALPVILIVPNLVALALFPGSSDPVPDERALRAILDSDPSRQPLLVDLKWVDAVLASDHWPAVNEPYMLRMVVESKCLDSRPLIAAMTRGEIPLLVLDRPIEAHLDNPNPDWPRPMLEAMAAHYEPLAEAPLLRIYRHRTALAFRHLPDATPIVARSAPRPLDSPPTTRR
jgi:hypothetical protein